MIQFIAIVLLSSTVSFSEKPVDPFFGSWLSGCLLNPDEKTSKIVIKNFEAIQDDKKGRFIFITKFYNDLYCKELDTSTILEGKHYIYLPNEEVYGIDFYFDNMSLFDIGKIIYQDGKKYVVFGKKTLDKDGKSKERRPTTLNDVIKYRNQ